ncbi:MAG: sigma-54-dependent Fis family transcriptional regulator [Phycisphaeraceae bacterium]|nr:sigma-54-dependent Fis family transcriptional regulator [Phycisphaeraceae bacterium]
MSMVLVVDDKEMLRDSVGATLSRAGLEVQTADGGQAALEAVARRRPDAVVTDLKMPGMTGLELLEQLRRLDDELPVVLMTAFGTVETAVRALKAGAFDYVTKPFEGDELIIAVKRAIEHGRLLRENAILRSGAAGEAPAASGLRGMGRIIGDSPAMRRVKEQIAAVAESHATVLICGESGTGKEVVAQAIHDCSPRGSGPFLGVNCAALSESLLESELFGHERGAFTGADRLRKGRFEMADRGTLLLDEISEISTKVQAKLLRVLQERVIERVGAGTPIGVDVRVIATSNRDLPKSVAGGEFRQDLFFRLNVLPIHLPPLRDRLEDVPQLAAHFVRTVAARDGKPPMSFDAAALEVLSRYSWPGNVRELQNICERAVVLCRGGAIGRDLVEPWLTGGAPAGPLKAIPLSQINGVARNGAAHELHEPKLGNSPAGTAGVVAIGGRVLEDIERDAIVQTLQKFNGHRQKTAQALGIGVRTLGLKLKKWKSLALVEQTL